MLGESTPLYAKLARQAAEHFVKESDVLPLPSMLPQELQRQRACFVSILENPGRRLRAMHGQALPQQPLLAAEIIANTTQAILNTANRPLRRPDLRQLRYSVTLVGPLQRVSSPEHLDPNRFGLYIRSDRSKIALILPNRSGIETGDEQLATALRESGANVREEAITMYRFDVQYSDN